MTTKITEPPPPLPPIQASTSGKLNMYWSEEAFGFELAMLLFDLFIPKFEFTSIEEVDPVDA